ncbi:MAG: hypothetical protein FWD49_03715 [Firmicutes bacterium]|nr:hypothetical protein [Bacillota bacterium]
MKTLIIYYSYSGKTKLLAERKASEIGADILPLTYKKRMCALKAYTSGCFSAIKRKPADLSDFNADFSNYERFMILMPIWAGMPAPPINNIIPLIPSESTAELIFTSGSGKSGKSGAIFSKTLNENNVTVLSVADIKANAIKRA